MGLDPRAPRFNQGVIGLASLAAFILDAPLVLPFLALLLAAGAFFGPQASPLALAWRHIVVPTLRLGQRTDCKDAAPVRFALAIGFTFLATASLLLLAAPHLTLLGWSLTLAVASLALLAATTNVCVGCEMYVLLRKWTARSKPA